ncbi:InlB B-repeat-containing protein [Bifidobacterium coryneforme]|uniref:RCC1 domain-containing protein n=1 Tax=Bifidobacterium coryneforme TaxID=1687 RepID=UPI0023F1D9C4|nr:InlB B-repeat-containing protein [Bifidobacterium coryneforme]
MHNNSVSRHIARPIIGALAVLAAMGVGLMAGSNPADAQLADQSALSRTEGDAGLQTLNPGKGSTLSPSDTPSSPLPTPSASRPAEPAPSSTTSTPQSDSGPSQLATPNPLSGEDSDQAAAKSREPAARSGDSHTVTFTSEAGTQGMPAAQTVVDRRTATRPLSDPTRPGWTFAGWFQGDVAYNFTRPVTKDTALTAKWGKWSISPTQGPWRGGTDVQANLPTDQNRFAQVSTGAMHSMAVGSDGNVYVWGSNRHSEFGIADIPYSMVPLMVPMPEGVKFIQVSAGYQFSMALDSQGRVWTWGDDGYGKLGRRPDAASPANRPGMVPMPTGVTFTSISAGQGHAVALDQNGEVWTWGPSWGGLIGRPSSSSASGDTPGKAQLPAGTVFTAISAGINHSMALAADGTVWTWGNGGDWLGHTGTSPAAVNTNLKFTDISAGGDHSMALDTGGTLQTWGSNDYGQLGRAPTTDNPSTQPGPVPGLTDISVIHAGNQYSAATSGTGSWAWGRNNQGQLGTNTTTDSATPTRMVAPDGAPAGFKYIGFAANGTSSFRTLVIGSDGNVYGTGNGTSGELGQNTTKSSLKTVMVWRPTSREITAVLFGDRNNAAGVYRRADGWHTSAPRQGIGTVDLIIRSTIDGIAQPDETGHQFTYTGTAATVTFQSEHGAPIPQQEVAVGDVAQRPSDPSEDGWTFDGWFQGDVAYDFITPITGPTTLKARWTYGNGQWSVHPSSGPRTGGNDIRLDPPSRIAFSQVVAGGWFSLGLGSDQNIYAWGSSSNGELGNGTTTGHNTPVKVPMPEGVKFTQVSAGNKHAMALDSEGRVWTWGSDFYGQLGRVPDGANPANKPGIIRTPTGVSFIAISAGSEFSVALDQDGNIWTWGDNGWRTLGRYATTAEERRTPGKVVMASGATFVAISAGSWHSTALSVDGTAWTWGYLDERSGRFGSTDSHNGTGPAPVNSNLKFTKVSSGSDYSLAIATDGTVLSWGRNGYGQLGRTPDDTNPAGRPGRIDNLSGVTDISTSQNSSSIAITSTGTWAWGHNNSGQLGIPTSMGSDSKGVPVPTRIPAPTDAPDGFSYLRVAPSNSYGHTLIIGSDGSTYGFGYAAAGQLGRGTVVQAETYESASVWFPWPLTLSGVTFDGVPAQGVVTRQTDGSWIARPPAHSPGQVELRVPWSRPGLDQGVEILPYTYLPLRHQVRFDPGNGDPVIIQTVDEWGLASRPDTDPTRAGYQFDGWFQGEAAYDFTQPISEDTTVTAKWSRPGSWSRSPASGPTGGGTSVTLTAPSGALGARLAGINAGGSHSVSVSSDGQVYAWGDNTHGQIGDGTHTGRTLPTGTAAPADVLFTQATAGRNHTAALDTAGRIWTWGDNSDGQLGRGTVGGDDSTPGLAATGDTRFTQINAGDDHTIALDTTGHVWTWGNDTYGQLGRGTAGSATGTPAIRPMPEGTPPGLVYTQIQAGGNHSLAIANNGTLYAWGDDTYGQLGDNKTGTATATPSPVRTPTVAPPSFTWLYLAAGKDHTLAIATDTTANTTAVYAFGSGRHGQIGKFGAGADNPLPTKTDLPNGADILRVSAGGQTSQAIISTGTLFTWGSNTNSQIGDGTNTDRKQPVAITTPGRANFTWKRAAVGISHTLGIDSAGTLHTWGDNTHGQLGEGTDTPRSTPGKTTFPALQVTSTVFGSRPGGNPNPHTDDSWQVTAPARKHRPGQVPLTIRWSLNGKPQPDTDLDYTYAPSRYTVTYDTDGGTPVPPDATVDEDGTTARPATDPTRADHVFDGWFDGDTAYDFTQPIDRDMTLTAHWHQPGHWTLSPDHGIDSGGETVTLTPPAPGGMRLAQVSAGSRNSLGIGSDGNAYAWGSNDSGQLGDGTRTDRSTPVRVATPTGAGNGFTWTQVQAGDSMGIGLGSDGNAYAWGSNTSGLGDGTSTSSALPVRVATPTGTAPEFRYTRISTGDGFALALGNDGQVYSWGSNSNGRLGQGNAISGSGLPGPIATPVGADKAPVFTQISAGAYHALALDEDGHAWAWGRNDNGQATPALSGDQTAPVQVPLPQGAPEGFAYTQLAAGGSHSLAIGTNQVVYGWGDNTHGQLADGRASQQPAQAKNPDTPNQALTARVISAAGDHSLAIGTSGTAYGFGQNTNHQGGTRAGSADLTEATPITIPADGVPTRISFDGQDSTNIRQQPDGTWQITTPAHDPGSATARVQWTIAGHPQPDDTSNTYTFQHTARLPNAGGIGIVLLLVVGLLTMAAAAARQRQLKGPRE